MEKNNQLNRWLWKWHVVAGLITLPFMFLLAITGVIYLFKDNVNEIAYEDAKFVGVPEQAVVLPYSQQLQAVKQYTDKMVMEVHLPSAPNQATAFKLHATGHAQHLVYVNPYTAQVSGEFVQTETFMYLVRKLHGELLLGKFGTYTVELVASWFTVLVLTGLYIWWPAKRWSVSGFFTIRTSQGKRVFYRDMHSVLGFWLSIFMLVILAGGMPWTDLFGSQLKWVQSQTDTGYPSTWRSSANQSQVTGANALNLDDMVAIAQQDNLPGAVTLKLPHGEAAVFTVGNRSTFLQDQVVKHYDQYTGGLVKAHTWDDVGILMDVRQVFMKLHQGQYGLISWLAVMIVALLFAVSTAAGLVSYLIRKPKGGWGLPTVPAGFRVDWVVVVLIIGMGVLFPMLGGSLLLLWIWETLRTRRAVNTQVASDKG